MPLHKGSMATIFLPALLLLECFQGDKGCIKCGTVRQGSYHCLSFIFIPPPAPLLAVGDFSFPPCCLALLQTTFLQKPPSLPFLGFSPAINFRAKELTVCPRQHLHRLGGLGGADSRMCRASSGPEQCLIYGSCVVYRYVQYGTE